MTREEYLKLLENFDFGWANPARYTQVLSWAGTFPAEYEAAYNRWKTKQNEHKHDKADGH
jgi:hypothetical protein